MKMINPLENQSTMSGLRLAELIAALSIATDLGMGQPMEFALNSCLLAVRLGDALGLSEHELREVYYQALLRYIGCNSGTHDMAAALGDELALRAGIARVDQGREPEIVSFLLSFMRRENEGASEEQLAQLAARTFAGLPRLMAEGFAGHCEVAQRLATRLGFGNEVVRNLGQLYERWDGKGAPGHLPGEQIAVAVLVVALAQDVVTFYRLGGVDAAVAMARERRGTAYEPGMVDRFCELAPLLCAGLGEEPPWEAVLAVEPGSRTYLTNEGLDVACQAIADFTDIKSPYLLGHSSGVAELAAAAGRHCGLPAADVVELRRAGLVHDVGRVGVSAGIWGKLGSLSASEWERVRLHPYYTERVLARPPSLARLGSLAALHHERLNGTGYHRGAPAAMLNPAARILAAADVYHAMIEPRPHRSAYSPTEAAVKLRREAYSGRLDPDAVEGVLAAAGHQVRPARRELVAGLSERQIEVLRLLARGYSVKQIAEVLTISNKTADNHVQHIYAKIGVSTRAGATLFAMEQDLL